MAGRLSVQTIKLALSGTKWLRAGQVANYLRQCGPLAFLDQEEYDLFRFATVAKQYSLVYSVLMRAKAMGQVDTVLGDERGRETRVFKLFDLV
jgi:hypothetical protein